MNKYISIIILSLSILGCASQNIRFTPEKLQQLTVELDTKVPALLQELNVPGVGIAVIQNGEIALIKGYGYADKESKQPVTKNTGFNIGSISKTIAAWGVMRLVEQGKVSLDAPVQQYIKRWRLPESEFDATKVTVRRLLSHTAGLSLHGYPGFGPNDQLPSIEESLSGATNGSDDVRLIMDPGTKWKYSGGGYTLSQLLVEEVTGKRFADYMKETVLTPLGMNNSNYNLTNEILAASATAYDEFGDVTPNPRFTAQAAAGLHTTTEDLTKFAMAILPIPDNNSIGRGVLKPETITIMLEPAAASEGHYGLGYSINSMFGITKAVGHGGSNRGWQAIMQIIPENRDGLIVLTNGSAGWGVFGQVICMLEEQLTGSVSKDQCKKPAIGALANALKDGGVKALKDHYRSLRKNHDNDYIFHPGILNRFGYLLLNQKKKVKDAIEIFKLNIEYYPDHANPHDSLGDAYDADGQLELALQQYEKARELGLKNKDEQSLMLMYENNIKRIKGKLQ